MKIEINIKLGDDALADTVEDIDKELDDTLNWMCERGLIDDYEMEVTAI